MTPFERAVFQLTAFCKSDRQRVFALKGPWGAGKSYLVRKFLRDSKDDLPTCTSYVSVFGLRTIQEVQERINGCIEYSSSAASLFGKAGRGLVTMLTTATSSVPHVSAKLPNFSNSAFWYIAKQLGVLIILDDLERAPELKLSQLLGLVSSITENSKARVLLVFNGEALEGENQADYTNLREKVLDGELTFRPTIEEVVAEHLGDASLADTVVQCLKAKGGPNIRRIRRIRNGLSDFRQTMTRGGIRFDQDDLTQVAKLIWLSDVAPSPLTESDRSNLSIWRTFPGLGERLDDATENAALRLARDVQMLPSAFDVLVIRYLADGFYSEADLSKFAAEDAERRESEEIAARVQDVVVRFSHNFLASESEVIQSVLSVLERWCAKLDLRQMMTLTWLLNVSGRQAEARAWGAKHLDAMMPTLDAKDCDRYLEVFVEEEHVGRLKQRSAELRPVLTPQEIIAAAVRDRAWYPADFERLLALDDSFYRRWFETADGDLLGEINQLFKAITTVNPDTVSVQLRQKLENILRTMAGESGINENRVRYVFGFGPTVPGNEGEPLKQLPP